MPRVLAITVVLLVALLGVVAWRYAPPPVVPATAAPTEFSGERAHAELVGLVADGGTRAIGTPGHARAADWLVARLGALGWSASRQETVSCAPHGVCARVANVVATLPGTEPGDGVVLLAAHYDSVGAGPGAGDDGLGVATLLETARALAAGPRSPRPVAILLSDGEEAGLLGARAFAREHPLVPSLRAVVNVDARGARGPSQMFQTSEGNAGVVRLVAAHLPRPVTSSLYYEVYRRMPNGTDFDLLKSLAPGVDFANTAGIAAYHSPLDTVDAVDPRTLQHDGDHVLAMARAFAAPASLEAGAGDAVWFDVLALVVVAWPLRWMPFLAGLALALLVGQLAWRRERGRGLAAFVVAPLGLATAFGVVWLLGMLGALPAFFVAEPRPALVAMHLAVLAVVAGAGAALGARAEVTWGGVWIGYAVVGVVLALAMPGASFLFVIPALVAGVIGLAPAAVGRPVVVVAPLLVAAVLVLALAPGLYEALGFAVAPMLALPTALVGVAMLPLLAGAGRLARRLAATLGVGAAVGFVLALLVPKFSAGQPQRANVLLRQDEQTAKVTVDTSWGAPRDRAAPAAMRAALAALGPPVGGGASVVVPRVALEPPVAETLAVEGAGAARRVRFRARSRRDANVVLLRLPAGRHVVVRVEGHEVSPRAGEVMLAGPPDAPLLLELEIDGAEPLEATLADRTYGLPVRSAARTVARARPVTAAPTQEGDTTTVSGVLHL